MVSFSLHVQRSFHTQTVDIYAVKRTSDESVFGRLDGSKIVYDGEPTPAGNTFASPPVPLISIPSHMVKELVEGLLSLGHTPDSTANLLGQLTATKEHLSDMRKLVFKENA
jgi:hypothetical protein